MGHSRCDDGLVLEGIRPVAGRYGAGRLADDGDTGRVTTECGDILVNPFNGGVLVEKADVACCLGRTRESEDVHAKIERNYDDVLRAGEVPAMVERRMTRASREAAAVDPYNHRFRYAPRSVCV